MSVAAAAAGGGLIVGFGVALALRTWLPDRATAKPTRRRAPSPVRTSDFVDQSELHGRSKHDMTPSQLAQRQAENPLIAMLLQLLDTHNISEACAKAEDLISDHLDAVDGKTPPSTPAWPTAKPTTPRPNSKPATELSKIAPRVASTRHGRLWQPLALRDALLDYDATEHVTCRKFIPPTFRELRNICNLAQVRPAIASPLQLLTFDGDKTLYPDRETLKRDSPLVPLLYALLRQGVILSLVTAVGFDEAKPYEERLGGLLSMLTEEGAPPDLCARLFVVGGQCNYLARCKSDKGVARLEMVPGEDWQLAEMRQWDPHVLQRLLDVAERALLDGAARLHMAGKVKLVRKERAVGVLYRDEMHRTTSLMLDDLALGARKAVRAEQRTNKALRDMPFCTFNGGKDVFVDIGSKDLGIVALQRLVGATPQSTLHVGDQFTLTGNDLLARRACGTLWVDSPEETAVLLAYMLKLLGESGANGSVKSGVNGAVKCGVNGSFKCGVKGSAAG